MMVRGERERRGGGERGILSLYHNCMNFKYTVIRSSSACTAANHDNIGSYLGVKQPLFTHAGQMDKEPACIQRHIKASFSKQTQLNCFQKCKKFPLFFLSPKTHRAAPQRHSVQFGFNYVKLTETKSHEYSSGHFRGKVTLNYS